MTTRTCPDCGRPLPGFGGWPAWCAGCGWGLADDETGAPPAAKRSRIAQWWADRPVRAEAAELVLLREDPAKLTQRHPRRFGVYAAAAVVHLVTLALIGFGLWVLTTGIVGVLKVFACVVAFGLVAITFPLRRLRPAAGVRRSRAPEAFAALDRLAGSLGVPTPRRLPALDQRVWAGLDRAGRTAYVAQDLAHAAAGDPRRHAFVQAAAGTLDGWLALLRPDPRSARRRARRAARGGWVGTGPSTAAGLSELLLPAVIAPLYLSVLAAGWLLRQGTAAAGLRATLLADRRAADLAGPAATREMLDAELAVSLAAAADSDALPVRGVPPTELDRRRRRAALTMLRGDDRQPPYAVRYEALDDLAAGPATAVILTPEEEAALSPDGLV